MVRVKFRYVLFEIHGGSDITQDELFHKLRDTVQNLHGDFGFACIRKALRVVYHNKLTRVAIVRLLREQLQVVTTALPMIRHIGEQHIRLSTVHIGGTIKQCHRALIKFHRKQLVGLLHRCEDQAVKQSLLEQLRSFKGKEAQSAVVDILSHTS